MTCFCWDQDYNEVMPPYQYWRALLGIARFVFKLTYGDHQIRQPSVSTRPLWLLYSGTGCKLAGKGWVWGEFIVLQFLLSHMIDTFLFIHLQVYKIRLLLSQRRFHVFQILHTFITHWQHKNNNYITNKIEWWRRNKNWKEIKGR